MLNIALQVLVIYSSLIFGKILYLIAKQEIKQGKKYIILARNIFIMLTSAALVYSNFKLSFILFLFLGFVIFIFLRKVNLLICFLIGFATLLGLLTLNPIMLLLFIFLLAIAHYSLTPPSKKEILLASVYFALPFSLFFIETFIKGNLDLLTSFIAGSLLAQLRGP